MTWTTDKPICPGWYWYRPPEDYKILMIYVREPFAGGGSLILHEVEFARNTFNIERNRVNNYHGQWAGPLTPPESPHADTRAG